MKLKKDEKRKEEMGKGEVGVERGVRGRDCREAGLFLFFFIQI